MKSYGSNFGKEICHLADIVKTIQNKKHYADIIKWCSMFTKLFSDKFEKLLTEVPSSTS